MAAPDRAAGEFHIPGPPRGLVAMVLVAVMTTPLLGEPKEHGGFTDVTEQAGLTHIQRREVDKGFPYLTGGGAVGDFFGNGYPDLFLTRNDDTDIFYKNMGDGTFKDVTEQVFGPEPINASTNGALMADLNNDGHLDLYVTTSNSQRHYLYINDGYGRLVEQSVERGAIGHPPPGNADNAGQSVTAGDYNNDGLLDLYITAWRSGGFAGPINRLLRNNRASEPGYFEDVTVEAGLDTSSNQYGFSGRFADMNQNGRLDLLTANDYSNSEYFHNNGDGTFTEVSAEMGTGTGKSEMGSNVADYNNDGWLDWFVTSISTATGNRLYRNEMHRGLEGIHFTDQTDAGVRDGNWGWGTSFIDYNNNGLRDLVMVNGYFLEQHDHTPMRFWRNNGPEEDFTFTEIGPEIGLTDDGQGRGLIVADFFNNGFLDVLVINNAAPPVLYRNEGGPNNWLRINTVGGTSNTMGIGAKITVQPDQDDDLKLYHEVNLGTNYLAHNETTAHFGLGDHDEPVAYIHIVWPSGKEQEFFDIEPNQVLTISEETGLETTTAQRLRQRP